MDFQTRFVLCSAPVFLRGRAFPLLPPQTGPQSISRCRASSSYALHIQAGVCKLVSTNILYSIRYPRSCQAPHIAFKSISDDFLRLLYGSKKSGLSPPSPPPKSATHQSLAHAGDFVQFPIHLKKTLPQKTEGSKRRIYLLVAPQDFAASFAPSVISIRPSGKTQRASTPSRDSMNARLSSYGIRNAAVESRSA